MRKVRPDEILPLAAYERGRDDLRRGVLALKALRRVHLGEHLVLHFENADTMRYQVQEMLRIEGLSREQDVRHELDTYNEILGGEGELGCTLMVEIDDPHRRDSALREWLDLPRHVYVVLADGSRCFARFDERQVGEGRLSAVQYLKFRCGDRPPTALGVDLPDLEHEVELASDLRAALARDLGG